MIEFYINENGIACVPLKIYNDSLEEIERLNNIINELENYCEEKIIEYNGEIKTIDNTMDKMNLLGARSSFNNILDKLQELKGDSSNE